MNNTISIPYTCWKCGTPHLAQSTDAIINKRIAELEQQVKERDEWIKIKDDTLLANERIVKELEQQLENVNSRLLNNGAKIDNDDVVVPWDKYLELKHVWISNNSKLVEALETITQVDTLEVHNPSKKMANIAAAALKEVQGE